MKLICLPLLAASVGLTLVSGLDAQEPKPAAPALGLTHLQRPKLVVGLMVDQMRWDFLYRYFDKYGEGGFKRLLREGFSCENAMIGQVPTFTAVGHATVYTGSVPAIHGITGNNWIEAVPNAALNEMPGVPVYCTDDSRFSVVGGQGAGQSPHKLLTTTITDELRLATNFRSQVVAISLKDRGSVIPAGHVDLPEERPAGAATVSAFWLDEANNFVTSSYYAKELPVWANQFNGAKVGEQLVSGEWYPLLPIKEYTQSTEDEAPWEVKTEPNGTLSFPHKISESYRQKVKDVIRNSPFGNSLTLQFAKAAVDGANLGGGSVTDFLAVSCSSTDYVGHKFGPNSIETEDTYLRLDRDLAEFFAHLDAKVGSGNYLVFLTADHGVAHSIGFMKKNRLPADEWKGSSLVDGLNTALKDQFGVEKLVFREYNNQFFFDAAKLTAEAARADAIKAAALAWLRLQPGVLFAVDMEKLGDTAVPEPLKTMLVNGWHRKRSGTLVIVPDPGWMPADKNTSTTHGAWNPYDTHIPVVFMGWGIRPGSTQDTVYMQDIAPTLAALLHIQAPNGSVGKPIRAVFR